MTIRLARVAKTISGVGFPVHQQGADSGVYPFLKVSDLARAENSERVVGAENWVSHEQARSMGAREVPPESVIFPKVGAALLGNARGHVKTAVLIDNNMMAVVPLRIDSRFLYWWLRTVDLADLNLGGTLPFVTDSAVRDLRVPVLPPGDQRRIADFLDDWVSRIDRIISARRQQVEYAEEVLARLSYDCIRGAAVSSERRNVGLQWLGSIPREWPVLSVSSQFVVDLGKMLDEKRQTGAHRIPYLRNTNVQWDAISIDDLKQMDIEESEYQRYTVDSGDLLICEGGQPGRSAIWRGDIQPLGYQKALHRARSRGRSHPEWLLECLRTAVELEVFASTSGQTTIAHLTNEQLRGQRFPFPEPETQDWLLKRLHQERSAGRRIIDGFQQSIDLLSEYKSSLITAAVTGELDVTTAGSSIPG